MLFPSKTAGALIICRKAAGAIPGFFTALFFALVASWAVQDLTAAAQTTPPMQKPPTVIHQEKDTLVVAVNRSIPLLPLACPMPQPAVLPLISGRPWQPRRA